LGGIVVWEVDADRRLEKLAKTKEMVTSDYSGASWVRG
jgi:hypothetical protein